MPTDGCHPVPADVSDSKLNATESPKLFATEKKSHDIIVLLLEQAKHQQQTVSRIRPWQNHSLAEAALCCCRLHGVRGDHRAGSWEAETRTYSCCGGTARSAGGQRRSSRQKSFPCATSWKSSWT